MNTTLRRILGGTAATLLTLTALIGFAHTKPGRPLRPLLYAFGSKGEAKGGAACPLGYDKASSPADIEAARQRQVASLKGTGQAPRKPALSFSLGQTTRAQIEAWVSERKLSCQAKPGPSQLTCTKVPDAALPPSHQGHTLDELYLQFNPENLLVSVGTVSSTHDAEQAARVDGALADALSRELGAPTSMQGERSPAFLKGGLLRQVRTEFRFADYFATTSATHMGQGRVVISERYELITSGS